MIESSAPHWRLRMDDRLPCLILFISRSPSQMSQVSQNIDFALPIPSYALLDSRRSLARGFLDKSYTQQVRNGQNRANTRNQVYHYGDQYISPHAEIVNGDSKPMRGMP